MNSSAYNARYKSFVMYSVDDEEVAPFLQRVLEEIADLGDVELNQIHIAQELSSQDMPWCARVSWCDVE